MIDLVPSDLVDVDHVFLSVYGQDLALAAFEGSPDDHNLVVLSDGHRSDLRRHVIEKLSVDRRQKWKTKIHTLYLALSSLESPEDMMIRLSWEGAWKWAFRDLRRELETSEFSRSIIRERGCQYELQS